MLNNASAAGARQCAAMVKRLPSPAHSELLKGFGPRLRAAREALGHKQAEFARLIGVTPQRLANWEADTNPPEVHMLPVLKNAGISIDYLLTGDMGNLTARLLQGLMGRSAGAGEQDVAGEARAILRGMADTQAPPRGKLHESQAAPPRRFLRPPGDIQHD